MKADKIKRIAYRSHSTNGLETVVVSRFKRQGEWVESGVFLVDMYCLGVKDAFFKAGDIGDYEDMLDKIYQGLSRTETEPSAARKLIEGAVRYASALGFSPHRDFKKGAKVFGGIDPAASSDSFEYGSEGKPMFVPGPNDSADKVERIVAQLERKCGADNFHFIAAGQQINLD